MDYIAAQATVFQFDFGRPNPGCLAGCDDLQAIFEGYEGQSDTFLSSFVQRSTRGIFSQLESFRSSHNYGIHRKALGAACLQASQCPGPEAGQCPLTHSAEPR